MTVGIPREGNERVLGLPAPAGPRQSSSVGGTRARGAAAAPRALRLGGLSYALGRGEGSRGREA